MAWSNLSSNQLCSWINIFDAVSTGALNWRGEVYDGEVTNKCITVADANYWLNIESIEGDSEKLVRKEQLISNVDPNSVRIELQVNPSAVYIGISDTLYTNGAVIINSNFPSGTTTNYKLTSYVYNNSALYQGTVVLNTMTFRGVTVFYNVGSSYPDGQARTMSLYINDVLRKQYIGSQYFIHDTYSLGNTVTLDSNITLSTNDKIKVVLD